MEDFEDLGPEGDDLPEESIDSESEYDPGPDESERGLRYAESCDGRSCGDMD